MAFTVSGLYVANWIDILDATQLAVDLSTTNVKIALYTTATPNFSTDATYSATGEVSGTGYTAGGIAVIGPTVTESPTGTLMYDNTTDPTWPASTITNANGAIWYALASTTKNLVVGMFLGGNFSTVSGTLTIQLASTGVFTIDLTP